MSTTSPQKPSRQYGITTLSNCAGAGRAWQGELPATRQLQRYALLGRGSQVLNIVPHYNSCMETRETTSPEGVPRSALTAIITQDGDLEEDTIAMLNGQALFKLARDMFDYRNSRYL